MVKICSKCKSSNQISPMDKKYLELFEVCWDCDKKAWVEGNLSLEEFEAREAQALNLSTTHDIKDFEPADFSGASDPDPEGR